MGTCRGRGRGWGIRAHGLLLAVGLTTTARHVLRDSEVREERRLIRAHLICSLPNAH